MPRFYLGADIRFAALAFGYTSVFAGLSMRFVMNGHSESPAERSSSCGK